MQKMEFSKPKKHSLFVNLVFYRLWFNPPTPNPILTKFTKWFLSRAINYLAPMKYMNCYQQMYVEL